MLMFRKKVYAIFVAIAVSELARAGDCKTVLEMVDIPRKVAVASSANFNDLRPLVNEGIQLICGPSRHRSAAAGIQVLNNAAEQQSPLAEFVLWQVYGSGLGVTQNPTEALKWLMRSAEHGNSSGQFYLGRLYLTGDIVEKDLRLAAKWIGMAAEKNFVSAQYLLGAMYRDGDGVEKNKQKAAEFLSLAANQGLIEARFALGMLFAKEFPPEQLGFAAMLVRSAAHQGLRQAQLELPEIERRNEAYIKNYSDQRRTIRIEAERGSMIHQRLLAQSLHNNSGDMAKNFEATQWYLAAAQQGDMEAQRGFAELTNEPFEKMKWYGAAAEQGDHISQASLAHLYLNGPEQLQDVQAGLTWLRAAAKNGNRRARLSLGDLYKMGRYVEINLVASYALYFSTNLYSPSEVEGRLLTFRPLVEDQMTEQEVSKAKELVRAMSNPEMFLSALDSVVGEFPAKVKL